MDELCVLQDDVPPFPDEQAFEIIEQNLGRPMEDVLAFISERPIAAASLGQVLLCPSRAPFARSQEDRRRSTGVEHTLVSQ